jgi:hypothetical protein
MHPSTREDCVEVGYMCESEVEGLGDLTGKAKLIVRGDSNFTYATTPRCVGHPIAITGAA